MNQAFEFSGLESLLQDDMITDINYNGQDLWCDHLKKGRIVYENFLTPQHFMNMCARFSNAVNAQFNTLSPVVESDYGLLRISMIHPSVSGRISLSIRKALATLRMSEKSMLNDRYITESGLRLLRYCVASRANIMISGLPGSGKTELTKFLTRFIPETERVITIEDSYELNYQTLHPHRDCISLKVSEHFSYNQAIRSSLRQRPNWLLVSEVRGEEVLALLQSVATGTHLISTIHARSAQEIPQRMALLVPDMNLSSETMHVKIVQHLDIGIHLDLKVLDTGIHRYVAEIVGYAEGKTVVLYHHLHKKAIRTIPAFLKEKGAQYEVIW